MAKLIWLIFQYWRIIGPGSLKNSKFKMKKSKLQFKIKNFYFLAVVFSFSFFGLGLNAEAARLYFDPAQGNFSADSQNCARSYGEASSGQMDIILLPCPKRGIGKRSKNTYKVKERRRRKFNFGLSEEDHASAVIPCGLAPGSLIHL